MTELQWTIMWGLLTFLVILPTVILALTTFLYLYTFKKSKSDKFNVPIIDLSFFAKSPIRALAKEGLIYMDTIKKERITIQSFDGFNLVGYYYPAPNATNKVLIGMHGFKSNPFDGFSPYIKFYHSLGYSLLIPYERAHGESEGKYITMGVNERFDCLNWINYVVNRFGKDAEILLHGVSMGGATVCSVAGENLPPQVKGIVSDCAFSSNIDETKFQFKKNLHMPVFPFLQYCNFLAKVIFKVDYNKDSALKQVEKATVPMLFVHGKKDAIVPVECSEKLYEKCSSKKELFIVENANHAESFGVDNEGYKNKIIEFFNLK